MRAIFPGKPRAQLQTVDTAQWNNQRLVIYISGNALNILNGPHSLIQTIYHDECPALEGVALSQGTGKIAVCDLQVVYVYRPYGHDEGALRWSLQSTFDISSDTQSSPTLSWGSFEELLVGASSLKLLQTTGDESVIWTRKLPKPIKIADFSPDANLIASTGFYDPLIKLWRRQSFGLDDTRFDFSYLPHPGTVTGVHWRKDHNGEQVHGNVLFSICADKKVRVWTAMNPHGLQALQQWAEIDMVESIQPRMSPTDLLPDRHAFFVHGQDFALASTKASQKLQHPGEIEQHALEHLSEIAKREPDICIVVDAHGHMSAWGLESVGCKVRRATNVFNVAHVEDLQLAFTSSKNAYEGRVQFLTFCDAGSDSVLNLLVQYFDGRLQWIEARPSELFDPAPRKDRVRTKAMWTGHDSTIKKIVRSASGRALLSRTSDNEGLIWKQHDEVGETALLRQSALSCSEHIHRTCLLREGKYVVNLHHQSISLWDVQSSEAVLVASRDYDLMGKPLCLIVLPGSGRTSSFVHIATMSSAMHGIVWEIQLPPATALNVGTPEVSTASIKHFCKFQTEIQEDLAFVLPVDPAGSLPLTSGFLDTFAKDVAVSYTDRGVLRTWTAALNIEKADVKWLVTSTVDTSIMRPSLASTSSIRKSAIVDSAKTGLTIWDMSSGQLEHEAHYESQDQIQDLDWSTTPDDQSILAVGFPHKVIVLAQMRFDYLSTGPAWASIREITLKESTPHPIGDSTWLGNGCLVIGAGNQLYVYDKEVTKSDSMIKHSFTPVHEHKAMDLFKLVTLLNGPLPLFHPQFLGQCILAGKAILVQRIILGLHKALKYFSTGDSLDSFVSLAPEDFYTDHEFVIDIAKKEMRSSYADFNDEQEDETVTEDVAAQLNERLAKLAIPQLSSHEQMYLADIIECVATAEKHRRSMDDNAMRYLLFFRQHVLRRGQAPEVRVKITWREIVWAFYSGSQDILVDLVSRQFQGKMLWSHARESGMFMWMTDLAALRAQFEVIARNEYTKTDEKNPVDCSLYYLALKKKNVLTGLWRMAAWNREQSATQKLLSNNFQDPRWKTAALKNAYALLGRHRFEYAASFFLLAGNLQAAVDVCVNQLNDLQLGVAIARVYDGDDSAVLHALLEDKVLPQAAFDGNRWLATWAFWMLGRRDMAVRVLISPVYTLVETPETPNLQSRSYLSSDPALVVLYKQLRAKTLQTLKGASKVSPRAEWEFVIQNARLYDRMGCDLLALDLVRNWEFLVQPKEPPPTKDAPPPDPRKLLRRRSSLVVDDLPSPRSPLEKRFSFGKPPPKPVFEEPAANSLLDNFGF